MTAIGLGSVRFFVALVAAMLERPAAEFRLVVHVSESRHAGGVEHPVTAMGLRSVEESVTDSERRTR